jgi:hypothetical protein
MWGVAKSCRIDQCLMRYSQCWRLASLRVWARWLAAARRRTGGSSRPRSAFRRSIASPGSRLLLPPRKVAQYDSAPLTLTGEVPWRSRRPVVRRCFSEIEELSRSFRISLRWLRVGLRSLRHRFWRGKSHPLQFCGMDKIFRKNSLDFSLVNSPVFELPLTLSVSLATRRIAPLSHKSGHERPL